MVGRWRLKPTVEPTIIAIGAVGGETGAGYAGGSAISADDDCRCLRLKVDARQRTAEFNGSRLKVIDFRQWRIPQAVNKSSCQNLGAAK